MRLRLQNELQTEQEKEVLTALYERTHIVFNTWREEQTKRREALLNAGKTEKEAEQYKTQTEIDLFNEWMEIQDSIYTIQQDLLDRYFQSFKGSIRKINKEAKKVLDALKYEDYIEHINDSKVGGYSAYLSTVGKSITPEELEEYRETQIHKISNCEEFLLACVGIYLEACEPENNDGKALNNTKIKRLIKEKLTKWGFTTSADTPSLFDNSNFPMYHGKATDTLARMSSRRTKPNNITGSMTIENRDMKVVMQKFKDLKATLGINTHKLLSVGVAYFTALNNYDRKGETTLRYTVQIPLEKYALSIGYLKDTARETEEEKKKYTNALKEAKKKIKKDLELLASMELTWKETIKGNSGDYVNIHIIGTRGIRNGYISMTFDPELSRYLAKLPITQYPTALLAIDARNQNAYSMGLKFAEHYNIDNNQKRGTATRLKVETLLGHCNLPSYEDVTKSRKSWEERIKEPFENALDELTDKKVLKDWRYSASKGIDLSDEAATTTIYEEWKEVFVEFELSDPADHTARLERRAEGRKTRTQNGRKKTTGKKS